MFQNLNYKLQRRDCRLMCCPSTKIVKSDSNFFSGYCVGEDKLRDILPGMTLTNVKTIQQTSLLHIESNLAIDSDCCCLPSVSVLNNKTDKARSNRF